MSSGVILDRCLQQWGAEWEALNATGQLAFQNACNEEWSTVRATLEVRELEDALVQCEAAQLGLESMGDSTCDQLRAIYLD